MALFSSVESETGLKWDHFEEAGISFVHCIINIGIILWLSTILHLISCDIIHFLHIIFDLFCIAGLINLEPQFGMVCWFDFEWMLLTLVLCSACFGRPRKLPKNQVCG